MIVYEVYAREYYASIEDGDTRLGVFLSKEKAQALVDKVKKQIAIADIEGFEETILDEEDREFFHLVCQYDSVGLVETEVIE